jgi:hypothetical protein
MLQRFTDEQAWGHDEVVTKSTFPAHTRVDVAPSHVAVCVVGVEMVLELAQGEASWASGTRKEALLCLRHAGMVHWRVIEANEAEPAGSRFACPHGRAFTGAKKASRCSGV